MAFEDVYRTSAAVQKRFMESRHFERTKRLSLYSSFENEPLTDEIFEAAAKLGKEISYPRVVKRHLEFFRVGSLSDLSPGSYEIPEPAGSLERVAPELFDLIVMPGVAFDLRGARLGYGKGYYDRALKGVRCKIAALAYDFQVLNERIPVEPHDVLVNVIVTEKRIIEV